MSEVGHNSGNEVLNGTAAEQLRAIVERVIRVEEDIDELSGDRKEIYAEAKGNGFDTKVLRKVVKAARQDKAKRQEEQAIFELYLSALDIL